MKNKLLVTIGCPNACTARRRDGIRILRIVVVAREAAVGVAGVDAFLVGFEAWEDAGYRPFECR